jgi:hypothetical protein
MPRNASGTYSLPSGNPVVSGNIIEASWANTTLNDLATEMTNSLSRAGAGGMTGALRLADGTSSVPGLAWGAETGTGFYRAGSNDTRLVVATNELQRWTASGSTVTGTLTATGQVKGGGSSGAQFLGNDVTYSGSRVFFATSADANQRINVGHYDSGTLSFPTGLVPAQILAGTSDLHIATRDVAGATLILRAGSGVPEIARLNSNGMKISGAAQTTPVAVAFSATAMTVDCRLSNVFTTTLTANVTTAPTISNPQDGQTINWFLTQDGTGSRTMTWPSSFKWPAGFSTVLSTAGNSVDMLTATYRSATGFWYASLLKSFA